jgi:peptidoglycan/LPS O-acetylase OafA/YrhL
VFHLSSRYFEFPALPFWKPGGDIAGWLAYSGFFGVQLFFVISGFVLALPFAQEHLAGGSPVLLKKYFWRRVTRLQPPYLISLIPFLVAALFLDDGTNSIDIGKYLEHLGAHALYLHGALYGALDSPGYFALNHVAWSLEVEVQFYIIAPLLATVFRVRNHAERRVLIVLAIIVSHGMMYLIPRAPFAVTVVPFLYYFLLGFLLVDIYIIDWKNQAPTRSYLWDGIGLSAWSIGPFLVGQSHTHDLYVLALILIAYVASFRGVLLSAFFRNGWIVAIGGMCYTIYLYHTLMLWPLHQFWDWLVFGKEVPTTLTAIMTQIVVLTASVIAISSVLFVLFEKPFMKRRRKLR